eukprot:752412-Hanusia_phi.AAC.2
MHLALSLKFLTTCSSHQPFLLPSASYSRPCLCASAASSGRAEATDVVEAVCHFMPADASDAPVVPRHGLRGAVERGLEDSSRNEDAVDLPRRVPHVERVGRNDVFKVRVLPDAPEALEVFEGTGRPHGRMADLEEHVLQLVNGLFPRLLVHPILPLERAVELLADLHQHVERMSARRLGEEVLHEDAGHVHVHGLSGREETLSPSRRKLRYAVDLVVVSHELVLEGKRQVRSETVHRLPSQVALDLGVARTLDQSLHLLQKLLVFHYQMPTIPAPHVWTTQRPEPLLPVNARHKLLQLRHACPLPMLISLSSVVLHGLGYRRLHLHDVVRIIDRLSSRPPRQLHDVEHHGLEREPTLRHALGGVQVVGAVGHRDASLRDEEAVDARVNAVGVHPPAEEDGHVGECEAGKGLHEGGMILD